MNRLVGRVALVTGAASGIGKATAQRLADEGAAVLVTDIQVEAGEATVKEINGGGGKAAFLKHDVTSETEWEAACVAAVEEFGGLDILVNNAGMGDIKPIEETTLAEWDRTVAIDQTGVFLGMKIAAPHLKTSEHASVINISSIFGTSGGFGVSPAYHAAKGAVRTLTKNVALRWATEGVRVNSIHPGFIATPILDMTRDLEIPKTAPAAVAQAVYDGLEACREDIFPDLMSASLEPVWDAGVIKMLERANSGLLSAAPS